MSTKPGDFIWYELMTSDPKAAAEFYGRVVGWANEPAMPGSDYLVVTMGGKRIAGMMEMPEQARNAGAPIAWRGYIATDDVDATTKRVTGAGGTLHYGPEDIPHVGRFASLCDAQGAGFLLFKPEPGSVAPDLTLNAPGTVSWHELHAEDGEKAFAFYEGLFGWTVVDSMDMGEHGKYRMFNTSGGPAVGATLTRFDPGMPPHWLYYFTVDDINAAKTRVKEAGGTPTRGPQQVPGGGFILHGTDPQGCTFALFSPPK